MARRTSKKYRGVYIVDGTDGKLSYGIDYSHPLTGKRVQKIIKGCKSEWDANNLRSIELADAARGAIDKSYGIKKASKAIPFESAVKLYAEWAEVNKKAYRVEKFKYPILTTFFKGKLLTDIHPFQVEAYKSQRSKVVGKKTVNQELIIGRQIFKKAIELKKYDGDNPFEHVENFKIPRHGKKPGCLTDSDVAAIIEAIGHPVKRDMVRFAYYTGWRISEIRTLKWSDVNFDEGVAYIMDSKNNENARMVLNAAALEIVKAQPRKGEFVFCRHNGTPYTSSMNAVIRNAAERAGVHLPEGKRWHAFRRTWASMNLQNGMDIVTLMEVGNWKDSEMVLWYAESLKDESKRAKLDEIPKLKKADARNTQDNEKVA